MRIITFWAAFVIMSIQIINVSLVNLSYIRIFLYSPKSELGFI